jgi:hypothetical protein
MRKKKYDVKFSYNIQLPIILNLFYKVVDAIDTYNAIHNNLVPYSIIKLVYNNEVYTLTANNFNNTKRIISFEKAVGFLKNGSAEIHLYDKKKLEQIESILINENISLKGEDINIDIETVHIHYDKNIYEINNSLSIIISLIEKFQGDLVLLVEQEDKENKLLLLYKNGNELNNIEDKVAICEKLYNEYKIEVFFPNLDRDIILEATIKKENEIITSDHHILNHFLQIARQYGYRIHLNENESFTSINFILKNKRLYDVLSQNIDIIELNSLVTNNNIYKKKLDIYKEKPFKNYAQFNSDYHYNKVFNQVINIDNIFNFILNKKYLVSINEWRDNIVINLYAPKSLFIANKAKTTTTTIVRRKSDKKKVITV